MHERIIRMALGAQIWRTITESSCGWVLDIMNAMTIDACRHIRVALLG